MVDVRSFLLIATTHLHRPIKVILDEWSGADGPRRRSWCAWTSFSRLGRDAGYWTGQLPVVDELGPTYIADGGTWGQPFSYEELAHIIIPRFFIEEYSSPVFTQWDCEQDIDGLSRLLNDAGVAHRLTDMVLELKRY